MGSIFICRARCVPALAFITPFVFSARKQEAVVYAGLEEAFSRRMRQSMKTRRQLEEIYITHTKMSLFSSYLKLIVVSHDENLADDASSG